MGKIRAIFSIIFIAACLTACSSNNQATSEVEQNAAAAQFGDSKSTKSNSSNSTNTANLTGISACDEYLSKVEMCLNKPDISEGIKNAYRQNLKQNRIVWKEAATSSENRSRLEERCKMAVDSAKAFFESCD